MESIISEAKRRISCCGPTSRCCPPRTRNPQRKHIIARENNLLLLLLALLIFLGQHAASTNSEGLASSSTANFSPRPQKTQTINNGDEPPPLFEDPPVAVEYIADTKLPTEVGHFRMRAYRIRRTNGERRTNDRIVDEPIVIYYAKKPPFGEDGKPAKNVPVRIHDQCLTSEVFGCKRCDSREQYMLALKYVKKHGGAIIYMQQEGRGIGLANKVAAYQLQDDMGMDTVDANLHLGLPEDCREYGSIPSILEDMNIESIRLLTNDPRKVERLAELGVDVTATIPFVVPETNLHNWRYLETKQQRMGHTNLASILPSSSSSSTTAFVTRKKGNNNRPKKSKGNGPPARQPIEISFAVEGNEDETAHDDVNDVDGTEGVVARADGYCFGKKSVESAIVAVARGEMVVVVDDMDRENEGDLIMAADKCTAVDMARIVRYSSGVICVAIEGHRMDELRLPDMVSNNEDPKNTAFGITVDATKEHGITTGISAADRAKTVRLLSDPESGARDFNRPGHLFPLRAREGGVLARNGHTEAAIDLSRLAGLNPCGILCEIVSEEHPAEMMRLPELKRFARQHGFVLTSIADLAQYMRDEMNHNSQENATKFDATESSS